LLAATEILVITGTYTNSAALLVDMGTGAGTTAISWQSNPTAGVGLLVAWTDGTNTYISKVSDADTADNVGMLATELSIVNIVNLAGVVTGFDTNNFLAVA